MSLTRRRSSARAVLAGMLRPSAVDAELTEIEASLNQQEGDWHELLSPAMSPALVIGIGLAVFQQFTGINT